MTPLSRSPILWQLRELVRKTLLCDAAEGRNIAASQHQIVRYATSINDPDDKAGRPTTPWARQVISGVDLMTHPKYNKGMAFSDSERDRLYIRGLLPPAILTQEVQLERIMLKIRSQTSDLERYNYMLNLQERNEHLFYRVLQDHFEELFHVVYRPTVHLACLQSSLMFRSIPRALFITPEDRGCITRILKNWPERNVNLVVVSDGEKVGGIGDTGVHAIRGPISKLAMYTACGGVSPSTCLPVIIDTGTDNRKLLRSPFYVGVRHTRMRGDPYYELLDEFMTALKRRYGNTVVVHFEDMAHDNVSQLLSMYRSEFPCFSDDTMGTASAVLAAVLAGLHKTGGRLADHVFLFSSNGADGASVAELFAAAIAQQTSQTVLEARQQIWLVDSSGLVTRERGDSSKLEGYKLPFCHGGPDAPDLLSAVQKVKPTVLVGLGSDGSQPFRFTQEVCSSMASSCPHPIIMPLSQGPSPEARAQDIYAWTQGRALVATEERTAAVQLASGAMVETSLCSSTYIFPGVGRGVLMSGATKLKDEQFIAAAEAVARLVTPEDVARGNLMPPLRNIREVACHVAQVVAQKAYQGGFATALPKPHNLLETARSSMYSPQYRTYR